jgi:hypothetical protein
MNNEITVEIKEGYLEVTLKGKVSLKDYLNLFSRVARDNELPKVLRVLGIDNGVEINFSPEDTLLLAKNREEVVKLFEDVKHAYLVNDPKNTALAVLSSSAMQSPNYAVRIFATKKAALDWLLQ